MDIMNMETFYDIGSADLKDIWESDLDPSESLKLSADTDMQDWFLERDVKIPAVILHDKLMSDALLGTLPIKTEHSYSLNSDGDSMPDSPGSLHNKMDDMDDECYPAISMNTATSNSRRLIDTTQQLNTIHTTPTPINSAISTTNIINNTCLLNSIQTTCIGSINPTSIQNSINPFNLRSKQQQQQEQHHHQQHQHNLQHQHLSHHQQQQQQQQQQLPQIANSTIDQIYNCSGNSSSASSMSSDIDIDDSCIKDEPMSPADDSSCPPSPINNNNNSSSYNGSNGCGNNSGISINMSNMAAITNTDLVFEHKLSPASQSLLKSQQIILPNGTTTSISNIATSPQRIILPKVNIKMEAQINQQQQLFGLPPTPPSSLPSDDSEGNQSPEHILLSPMSPPTQQLMSATGSSGINSPSSSPTCSGGSTRRNNGSSGSGNANNMTSSTTSTSSSSSSSSSGGNSSMHNSSSAGGVAGGRGYTGTSTRQPIHTPLISSQPKGSTGTLILTEEEKRTLLAEGYPIPTRLPLTKAEEKSLKKIRRKIKNKISAQESRRKKKEYMDQLERKVEILVSENTDYRKRVETLEDSNANLLNQLQKLQALVNRQKK